MVNPPTSIKDLSSYCTFFSNVCRSNSGRDGLVVLIASIHAVLAALQRRMVVTFVAECHLLFVNMSECEVKDNSEDTALEVPLVQDSKIAMIELDSQL